jgi:hypothetical protein
MNAWHPFLFLIFIICANDNALAESKNSSIVRKYFGYVHIEPKWAPLINEFNRNYLTPYLNFHSPCYFAEIKPDKKGKEKKTYPYRSIITPFVMVKCSMAVILFSSCRRVTRALP